MVLDAAAALFAEQGYAGFSIGAIVERTGVAKTTIYRHWPTQSHLLLEVISRLGQHYEIPDTGDLRQDLIDHFVGFVRSGYHDRKNSSLLSLPALMMATEREPALVDLVALTTSALLQVLRVILERGKLRGEVSADHDLDTLVYLVFGAISTRSSLLGQEFGEAQMVEAIDAALDGVSPRTRSRRRPPALPR